MTAWGWVLLGVGIWGALIVVTPVVWVGLCALFGDLKNTGGGRGPNPRAAPPPSPGRNSSATHPPRDVV
ncbi:MAG: hypothetical protein M3P18_00165, partial [Actinomycetota bacterium]|nr:hypothetical protein [Actinomycetota bacterium]